MRTSLIRRAIVRHATERGVRIGIDAEAAAEHFIALARGASAIDARRAGGARRIRFAVVFHAAEDVIRLRVDAYPAAQLFRLQTRLFGCAHAIDASRAIGTSAIARAIGGDAAIQWVGFRVDADVAAFDFASLGIAIVCRRQEWFALAIDASLRWRARRKPATLRIDAAE